MKGRKRVYIDWTYYQPCNLNPIAASFTKDDEDYIAYVRESDAKNEIAEWKRSAETWKKAYMKMARRITKPSCREERGEE